MSEIPENLSYTKEHEWVNLQDDGNVKVGITDHAQDALSDVVFVELPNVGAGFSKGDTMAVAESVKAASDIYAPVSGKISSVNTKLEESPELINESPYDFGWMVVIEPSEEFENFYSDLTDATVNYELRILDITRLEEEQVFVDDIDMKISHIIRGEDHITKSAIQIEIFNALDTQSPIFGHNSLLVRENGRPFSKRNAASSIVQLKEESFDPNAINSLNVSIGSSIDIEAFTSLKEMSEKFNIKSLGKAPARYSLDQLSKLNSQIISDYSFSKISELLDNKLSNFSEEFWDCIKQNISHLSEIDEWYNIINANIEAKIDDVEYLNLSEELLPEEPWDESTWDNWIALLKDKTSKSGKELFLPIRIALTGKSHGPELNKLILLLGYNEVKRRLLRN